MRRATPSSSTRADASPSASPRAVPPPLGVTVQRLRKQAGLTLSDLAQRCGISISAVSKIENGQVSPTYDTILRLAKGLEVAVADLFREAPPPAASEARLTVTRAGEGVPHSTAAYDYEMLCAGLASREFSPFLTRIRAHDLAEENAVLDHHDGEEFLYVVSGAVILHSEHYAPLTLGAGDSCYFDSRMGHALTSASDDDALVLWIATSLHGSLQSAATGTGVPLDIGPPSDQ